MTINQRMVLVPGEPTEKMLDAGEQELDSRVEARNVYLAMLLVAPELGFHPYRCRYCHQPVSTIRADLRRHLLHCPLSQSYMDGE